MNPSCIAHVVGSADELIEGKDTMDARKGIKRYERMISNNFGIINPDGIIGIKLKKA